MNSTLLKAFLSIITTLLFLIGTHAVAAIELSPLFNHGAVLQRDQPIPIWGTAKPNAEVTVSLGTKELKTTSDEKGGWQVEFSAQKAGGPMFLKIESDEDRTTLTNILIGDVWFCGGQSNMEWLLKDSMHGVNEIETADYPAIRQFKVPHTWSTAPSQDIEGQGWVSARKNKVAHFSAVAYFFAQKVYRETGVPIGLVSSNWSGSNIESWMSSSALNESPKTSIDRIKKINTQFQNQNHEVTQILSRWPNALQSNFVSGKADWSSPDIHTGDWRTIHAPQLWEEQDLPNIDGIIWYRKKFSLNETEAKQTARLGLARIDDQDSVWVNGHQIGSTNTYNTIREYSIPASILRKGTNSIAIRIVDNGGGGGIYSDKELLFIELATGTRYSLAGDWLYKADKVYLNNDAGMHHIPTALYNKMVHPLFNHPIKGVIWYQGESNAGTILQAQKYRAQFQNLIRDWRVSWQQPTMPFYWVQLASYDSGRNTPQGSPWAILRQAQSDALRLPNTGQVVSLDVGDPNDIHPRDKRTVGYRLANIALNQTYGKDFIHFRGPHQTGVYHTNKNLIIEFNSQEQLMISDNKDNLARGFEIIFANGDIKPAAGKIIGNTVKLELSTTMGTPAAVRYAWNDNPNQANLHDKKGLPAEPFLAPVKRRK